MIRTWRVRSRRWPATVAALPAVDLLDIGAQGWNCIVNGDFETEGGFACVVAVDLTSVGDVRDLLGVAAP